MTLVRCLYYLSIPHFRILETVEPAVGELTALSIPHFRILVGYNNAWGVGDTIFQFLILGYQAVADKRLAELLHFQFLILGYGYCVRRPCPSYLPTFNSSF